MNKNEMLKRITEKKTAIEDEIAKRELEKTERLHQLEELILNDYFKRVCDLVEVANAMIKTGIGCKIHDFGGIKFAHYMNGSNCRYDFMASAFFHNIGFTHIRNSNEIDGIGILAGGACGPRSLYVDTLVGVCIFIDDDFNHRECVHTEGDIQSMQLFIEQFDGFEKEFYEFVEDITKY